ncbi:type II secretion system secretin GspD [Rivibacter subsaxonicus]|nr:type II secretion system secretin GspD [Rivibacter subsaxonicus]
MPSPTQRAPSRSLSARAATASQRLSALGLAAALTLASLPVPAQPQAGRDRLTQAREPVTLNFVNAEIDGVARAVGAILERQIVVDPRVKGQITLYSEQAVTPREAYLNFLAALRGLGFAVVESGGLLKVVPEAEAKLQTGTVSVGSVTRSGDQIITQIFRLQHESANNMVTVLRPLITPNNTINANPGNNSLVITDYADNLQRLAKIIAGLDVPASTDLEVIAIQHGVASDLAPLIARLADGAPVSGAPAAATGGLQVLADPRTNSLLVKASSPARLAIVRGLVEKLDKPGVTGAAGSNIHVVYLKNADAAKLAPVLRAAFASGSGGTTGAAGGGTTGGASPLAGALGAAAGATPAGGAAGTGGATSIQATSPLAGSGQAQTGGFIQADPNTNSLIITAAEPLYRQLRAVIEQLDSRRAQVYVETMIVEVNANKAADIGFQWQGLIGKEGDKYGLAGGTNFGTGGNNLLNLSAAIATGSALAATLPSAGLNLALIRDFGGTYALSALARFLETNADGNILSTPNLVTLDNEEARITIGQNVPFVTGSFTNTGTAGGAVNPFQTIERKDVGITLRVKPQIGENGTVRLQIYQEVSNVVDQRVSQGIAPANAGLITNKRAIESNVVVDDGNIIVLGGLMQDTYQGGEDRLPYLGSLPVVGALFRANNRSRVKTNLMVFLRPVVMRDQESTTKLSLDRYDLIRAEQRGLQPPSRPLMPIKESAVLPEARPPAGTSPQQPLWPDGFAVPQAPAPAASEPQR